MIEIREGIARAQRGIAFGRRRTLICAFALIGLLTVSAPLPAANNPQQTGSPVYRLVEKLEGLAKKGSGNPKPYGGSAKSPNAQPSAVANSAPSASAKPTEPVIDGRQVISYLGEVISWYHHFDIEERLATEPAETIYVADDRQNANRILELGFQYAEAAAKLLNHEAGTAPPAAAVAPPLAASSAGGQPAANQMQDLLQHRAQAENGAAAAKTRVDQLKSALAHARGKQRNSLNHQLATAQAELSLAQSRVDSYNAMIDFENQSGIGSPASALEAQIEQLKSAATPAGLAKNGETAAPRPVPAERGGSAASGIVGQAEMLIALTQKQQTLADTVDLTKQLGATVDQLRKPLVQALEQINQQVMTLAANSSANDLAALKDAQLRVQRLTRMHKLIIAALLPLSKQNVALNQYAANLGRWRGLVQQRFSAGLRNLLIRLGGLAILLLAVVVGAAIWRRLTFRYVRDIQHRYHLMQLSRIVVLVIIALVLLFDFANQLGALATVMGFAAAGIALTLQNVILSLAGYFYISGRYGIRLGDRVQISNINGDVLEIGLFKMTLLELAGEQSGFQPTGRVVVFPNSVVFQPNGNFSKQLPGSDVTWNELRLSLAPDCDYRLAERRLVEVVNAVFTRYRDAIQREYRGLERELNLPLETPRPQSRLHLSDSGVDIVIRYPAQLKSAVQTADEIARRLVDAIKREPALKLATPGTPVIQPVALPEAAGAVSNGGGQAPPSQPPLSQPPAPPVDNQEAGMAAAAAAGATVAKALIETTAGEQEREGVRPAPAADPGKK